MDDAVDVAKPPKRRMGNGGPIMCDPHFNTPEHKIVVVLIQY